MYCEHTLFTMLFHTFKHNAPWERGQTLNIQKDNLGGICVQPLSDSGMWHFSSPNWSWTHNKKDNELCSFWDQKTCYWGTIVHMHALRHASSTWTVETCTLLRLLNEILFKKDHEVYMLINDSIIPHPRWFHTSLMFLVHSLSKHIWGTIRNQALSKVLVTQEWHDRAYLYCRKELLAM